VQTGTQRVTKHEKVTVLKEPAVYEWRFKETRSSKHVPKYVGDSKLATIFMGDGEKQWDEFRPVSEEQCETRYRKTYDWRRTGTEKLKPFQYLGDVNVSSLKNWDTKKPWEEYRPVTKQQCERKYRDVKQTKEVQRKRRVRKQRNVYDKIQHKQLPVVLDGVVYRRIPFRYKDKIYNRLPLEAELIRTESYEEEEPYTATQEYTVREAYDACTTLTDWEGPYAPTTKSPVKGLRHRLTGAEHERYTHDYRYELTPMTWEYNGTTWVSLDREVAKKVFKKVVVSTEPYEHCYTVTKSEGPYPPTNGTPAKGTTHRLVSAVQEQGNYRYKLAGPLTWEYNGTEWVSRTSKVKTKTYEKVLVRDAVYEEQERTSEVDEPVFGERCD
jgi:hypothetical protein